jgi:hypothetical protein
MATNKPVTLRGRRCATARQGDEIIHLFFANLLG